MVPAPIRHQTNSFQELTGLHSTADLSHLQHRSNVTELPDRVKWDWARRVSCPPTWGARPLSRGAGARAEAPPSIALDFSREDAGEEGWSKPFIQGWPVRPLASERKGERRERLKIGPRNPSPSAPCSSPKPLTSLFVGGCSQGPKWFRQHAGD